VNAWCNTASVIPAQSMPDKEINTRLEDSKYDKRSWKRYLKVHERRAASLPYLRYMRFCPRGRENFAQST